MNIKIAQVKNLMVICGKRLNTAEERTERKMKK